MPERYVRPPLVGRERRSVALQVWPFRVLALLLLALVAWVFILLVKHLLNPEAQAPGIGALRAAASPPAAAPPAAAMAARSSQLNWP